MELGYHIVIPTFVFLDSNLSPLERLLYGVLSSQTNRLGYCTATNEALASSLRFKSDGVVKQITPESVSRMLKHLEECGHIKRSEQNGSRAIIVMFQQQEVEVTLKAKPVPAKVADVNETAVQVLKYLSDANITRGYRKVEIKPTKANLENIVGRLNDGYTYDLCIGVINIKFEDKWFKENPKYLSPITLFRPSKFEQYVGELSRIKDIEKKTVTKTGLSSSSQQTVEKEVEGQTF